MINCYFAKDTDCRRKNIFTFYFLLFTFENDQRTNSRLEGQSDVPEEASLTLMPGNQK